MDETCIRKTPTLNYRQDIRNTPILNYRQDTPILNYRQDIRNTPILTDEQKIRYTSILNSKFTDTERWTKHQEYYKYHTKWYRRCYSFEMKKKKYNLREGKPVVGRLSTMLTTSNRTAQTAYICWNTKRYFCCQRWIHHSKSDWINIMDQTHVSGIESSSGNRILIQRTLTYYRRLKCCVKIMPDQVETKWNFVINKIQCNNSNKL